MTDWCTLKAPECCRTLTEADCVSGVRIKVVTRESTPRPYIGRGFFL